LKGSIKKEHLYVSVVLCLIIVLGQVYAEYISVGAAPPNHEIRETFKVSITLPSEIRDLYAWQAVITFNPSVVMVLDVENGGFLSSNTLTINTSSLSIPMDGSRQLETGDSLFIVSYGDVEVGKIVLAETKVGKVPGVSGSGTLATITFGVYEQGSYDVRLLEASLFDPNLEPIKQVSLTSPS